MYQLQQVLCTQELMERGQNQLQPRNQITFGNINPKNISGNIVSKPLNYIKVYTICMYIYIYM